MPTLLSLERRLAKLLSRRQAERTTQTPLLNRLRADPARVMIEVGMTPDRWQTDLMRAAWTRALLLCSRQAGKSQVAGALALGEALTRPRSLVLLLSPTLRQSGELFRDKLLPLWQALGRPLLDRSPTQLSLELANGSRIISLPESEGGIRGYSGVRLLVIDEAARVGDDLYRAVRPMLAVSGGRLLAMSTPYGRRGWFFESWTGRQPWKRVRVPATACPRITAEFLAEEREALGLRWFHQEYLTGSPDGSDDFTDVVGAVFSQADIDAATRETVPSLFGDY